MKTSISDCSKIINRVLPKADVEKGKHCYKCGGQGFHPVITKLSPDWIFSDYTVSFGRCDVCKGTGVFDFIDHVLRKRYYPIISPF